MLFSIIVPIYKVEKYLKRCIDSILSQNFRDFELILVDDGSPDGCPAICDAYAQSDDRIKVIHKANGGLVSARQAGIAIAQGEYVLNVDSDDAVLEEALQHASEIIEKTHADIISFSYQSYKNGSVGETVCDLLPEGLYNREEIEKQLFPKLLVNKNMEHMFYFVWGKAFKRALITPHQLNVSTSISLGEDLSCLVPCYLEAQSVYISKQPVYLYTIRDDSISTSFNTKQICQIAEVIEGLRKAETSALADFEAQIARYSCFMCFAILASAAEGGHFSALGEIKHLIRHSVHNELISRAEFDGITAKSRIAIGLMKKRLIEPAFYFLYMCKLFKQILKKGR